MLNFEHIYKTRINKLIDKIITTQIIAEKEYLETKEYKYFNDVKSHYSLTCVLFLANQKNMENDFLEVIKDNLKQSYDYFYKSYINLKAFIDEIFIDDKDFLTNKMKITYKIDLVRYCYNLNFYEMIHPNKEFNNDKESLFLDAIFKTMLERIKIIFKEFV